MANHEHLEILQRGIEVWNNWRENNPDIEPDLEGASLSGAYEQGAFEQGAFEQGANLSGANLSGTNLSRANLSRANLSEAIYDSHTLFPNGFDPVQAGMVRSV